MSISDWSSDVCSSDHSGAPEPETATSMFTKSPGTSRPATPRTWLIEMVMATSLFLRRLENVESDSAWDTNWLLTTTWLTGRSEMATRPSIWAGLVMAVGGRYSAAMTSSSIIPRANASSPKVPLGMSWKILNTWTRLALSLASSSMSSEERHGGKEGVHTD